MLCQTKRARVCAWEATLGERDQTLDSHALPRAWPEEAVPSAVSGARPPRTDILLAKIGRQGLGLSEAFMLWLVARRGGGLPLARTRQLRHDRILGTTVIHWRKDGNKSNEHFSV